jgi:3' terminal RNA ribose 2'-O-methyltransferase Hen1
MLFTISTTHKPATDLGYLLHKHPDRVQTTDLSFGTATVAYPEASEDRCTAALFVDVDQVDLVRGRRDGAREAVTLGQYVNDRPYAASSFLSTAIGKCFGTAMGGRSKERPELAALKLPLVATIAALPCRGGESILRRLFEPLGYVVTAKPLPLDATIPSWGMSQYFDVVLSGTVTVRELLEHLYVLTPVLDNAKHYWVVEEEIERLIRRGGTWLAAHPDREMISARALRYDRRLTREALTRLTSLDSGGAEIDVDRTDERADQAEEAAEERISLNDLCRSRRSGDVFARRGRAGCGGRCLSSQRRPHSDRVARPSVGPPECREPVRRCVPALLLGRCGASGSPTRTVPSVGS